MPTPDPSIIMVERWGRRVATAKAIVWRYHHEHKEKDKTYETSEIRN